MLTDPRSIAFVVDAIHPQIQHSPQALQSFFGRQAEIPEMGYLNFNTNAFGAQLTTVYGPASLPGSTAHSALSFGADRFQIKEEWPRIGLDDFVGRAMKSTELAFDCLAIPQLVAVQCTIRSLVNLATQEDCRTFLDGEFFRIDDEDRGLLGRQPGLFGLRMAFPATEDDKGVHNVRIESFNGDPRSLFLEETGVWTGVIQKSDLRPVEAAIREAYGFLTGGVTDWIAERLSD
ncbi:MAG: hypothetical protein KDB53_09000 [Planctomycetes bacterium]|nr:hypothetical protein [Planctomycetota bacterium]